MTGTSSQARTNRVTERITGLHILLVASLSVLAILTSQDIIPETATVLDDVRYLAENQFRIITNNYLWLGNALLIIMLAPLVLVCFRPYNTVMPFLFAFAVAAAGIVNLMYAVYGFNMVRVLDIFILAEERNKSILAYLCLNTLMIRHSLKLVAFTTAGISGVIVGMYILATRRLPVFTGGFILLGGILYAVFGWFGPNNLIFSLGRLLFILSLLLFGSILMLKGIRKNH